MKKFADFYSDSFLSSLTKKLSENISPKVFKSACEFKVLSRFTKLLTIIFKKISLYGRD